MNDDRTSQLQELLDCANRGDGVALRELIGRAYERLRRLASKMLRQDYPRLGNVHGTDSVVNRASVRLLEALQAVRPPTVLDFFRLAAARIRCILLDLARKFDRDNRTFRRLHQDEPVAEAEGPSAIALWEELHRKVNELPRDEREVFKLLWYAGLTKVEAAQLLAVHPKTISYRWHKACLRLADLVQGFADFL
jgi:RNA polymerase sigma factor (sigma-70 family)